MGYINFDDDLPARIKEQADIVQIIGEHVELRKAGVRFLGCCPFHNENTPSFSVHPGQQFYYCFGCGASGDVFEFQMKYHNMDFPEALKELAGRYQIPLPQRSMSKQEQEKNQLRKKMYGLNKKVAAIFRDCLQKSNLASSGREYLEKRGIPLKIQEEFGLGYVPSPDDAGWSFLGSQLNSKEVQTAIALGLLVQKKKGGTYDRFRNRVLFPIYDRRGSVLGFGGRIIGEGHPKYINSPESLIFNKSASLLGLYQQGDAIRRCKQAILVEGNFDLVSLVVHGCTNVVAPLGTALSPQQVKILSRYADECVLLFDGDTAGVKAAVRAVPLFLAEEFTGRVALLPQGHDPDTFIREKGLVVLEELLGSAMPLPEFTLQELVKEHGVTFDGKRRIIEALHPLLRAAKNPLQRSLMLAHFSETIGVSSSDLNRAMPVEKIASPLPPEPEREGGEEHIRPLSASQHRLLTHIVLYPDSIKELVKAGLRDCLRGTAGEVLFLQLLELLEKTVDLEPEELMNKLPAGGERALVSDILLGSVAGSTGLSCNGSDGEIKELVAWLERENLQRQSRILMEQIVRFESEKHYQERDACLLKKIRIDKQLQELRKKNNVFPE